MATCTVPGPVLIASLEEHGWSVIRQPAEIASGVGVRLPPPPGPGAQVGALALAAEQAEELDGLAVTRAEPVRHPGVKFRRLARLVPSRVIPSASRPQVMRPKPSLSVVGR